MKYRIKDRAPQHYVGGRMYGPGEIVEYPDAMKPGIWLEPIDSIEPVKRGPGRPRKEKSE